MSYARAPHGLGQAKIVPGQISFQTLPEGRSGFPSLDPLVQAGLPIAPYIEHGSWETGQPDIMRYGLDPYRGIMGLGCCGPTPPQDAALGQLLTSTLCDPTTVSASFQSRLTSALNAGSQAALVGGAIAGVLGALAGRRSTLLGAVAGAAAGWTANLVWTSTHRV